MRIIKTFYKITLHFKSPIHIGMGSHDDYMGAAQIVQNGVGEYLLPGTSLAGLFMHSLTRDVNSESLNKEQVQWLTEVKKDQHASRIIFRSAVLIPADRAENQIAKQALRYRDKVRISRKTRVAEDGAKFSQWELIPNDTEILIEFDRLDRDNDRSDTVKRDSFQRYMEFIESYIDSAILRWQEEGLFVGGKTGTGNGRCSLSTISKWQLTTENYDEYLERSYIDLLSAVNWQVLDKPMPLPAISKNFVARYRLSVTVDYMNPLLIKGGDSNISMINPDTDAAFIQRNGFPFIPGSSIRGAVSAFMDKYLKEEWRDLLAQPIEDNDPPQKAGALIFTDLYLVSQYREEKAMKDRLIKMERHAEDQFSRAIYGSGKFDEERLFDAVFEGEILIRSNVIDMSKVYSLIAFLKQGMQFNLISMGSGACYPKMELEDL